MAEQQPRLIRIPVPLPATRRGMLMTSASYSLARLPELKEPLRDPVEHAMASARKVQR